MNQNKRLKNIKGQKKSNVSLWWPKIRPITLHVGSCKYVAVVEFLFDSLCLRSLMSNDNFRHAAPLFFLFLFPIQ